MLGKVLSPTERQRIDRADPETVAEVLRKRGSPPRRCLPGRDERGVYDVVVSAWTVCGRRHKDARTAGG